MAFYGLILVFVLEYIRPGSYFPILVTLKVGTIVPIAIFLTSLFLKSRTSHSDIWGNGNTRWLLFFVFMVTLSLLFHYSVYVPGRFSQALGYFFMFYSMGRLVDSPEKLKKFFAALILIHITLIVLNPDLILDPSTRSLISGTTFLGDGNDFGLSLCVVFPLALYLFLQAERKIIRVIFMSGALLCVLGVVGTQSRGASLALGSIFLYLWLKSRNKALGIIALGILIVAALLFASPEYFARMGTIATYESDGSAQGRIHAWTSATLVAFQHPLLGVGAGNFPSINRGLTAHSSYFLVLAELGFPGLLFLISVVVLNMRSARKRLKEIASESTSDRTYHNLFICLNSSMIGFAVAGAFLSATYYPHIFVLGGMFLVANRLYKMHLEQESEAETDVVPGNQVSRRRRHFSSGSRNKQLRLHGRRLK